MELSDTLSDSSITVLFSLTINFFIAPLTVDTHYFALLPCFYYPLFIATTVDSTRFLFGIFL